MSVVTIHCIFYLSLRNKIIAVAVMVLALFESLISLQPKKLVYIYEDAVGAYVSGQA